MSLMNGGTTDIIDSKFCSQSGFYFSHFTNSVSLTILLIAKTFSISTLKWESEKSASSSWSRTSRLGRRNSGMNNFQKESSLYSSSLFSDSTSSIICVLRSSNYPIDCSNNIVSRPEIYASSDSMILSTYFFYLLGSMSRAVVNCLPNYFNF
jgi:hypothetical protein